MRVMAADYPLLRSRANLAPRMEIHLSDLPPSEMAYPERENINTTLRHWSLIIVLEHPVHPGVSQCFDASDRIRK